MDWMVAIGSVSLGLLIGALVGWFVNEAMVMDRPVLSSSVYIMTGGGVLALFAFLAGHVPREIWLYPLGLLIGFFAVTAIEVWYWGYDGKKREHKKKMKS